MLFTFILCCNYCFSQEKKSPSEKNSELKVIKQPINNGPVALWVRKGSGPRCHRWGICFIHGPRPGGPKVEDKTIPYDSNSEDFEAWAILKGKKLTLTFYYPLESHDTLPIDNKCAFTEDMNKKFKVIDGYILPGNYVMKYTCNSLAVVDVDVVYK